MSLQNARVNLQRPPGLAGGKFAPIRCESGMVVVAIVTPNDAAEAIVARKRGEPLDRLGRDFATIGDGVATMQFMAAALESSRTGGWTEVGRTE
jgi:hypothetical protein